MVKMRLLAGLLALLLFLCMAHPCAGASGRGMVVVFKGDKTEVAYKENNGTVTKLKPLSFCLPAFVVGVFNGKEFLMAFCAANYKSHSEGSFIAPAVRTSYGDYKTWNDAEIIAKTTRKKKGQTVLRGITAVMKSNKVYAFVSIWDAKCGCWRSVTNSAGWDPLMIVGTVTNRTESNGTAGGVYVKWDKGISLKSILPKTVLGATGFRYVGGLGNGIVTKNGTIIIPIQIANDRWDYASSIMYSTDNGSSWHIGGTTEQGISQCSVTEWGNGKLLLSASYDFGYRNVYESDDMGTTWKESLMFSGVWGNNPYRREYGSQGSLITVPVDGKDILLFSHLMNTRDDYERDTLQLWMSDGQRIKCVGTISEYGKGEDSGYSILAYVGDHLYSMHEVNPYMQKTNYNDTLKEWDRVIALSLLSDLFDRVKSTVRVWRHVDDQLKKIHVPTNGLVGFLAGSNDNNVWEDEYNSVNATVRGATPVQGGFSFNGKAGSGAQWGVQDQGQNQLYFFTEKQFTIAATVTIHEIQRYGNNSLFGASEDEAGTRVLIGLGYTQDEGWYVVDSGDIIRNNNVKVEMHKEYHLAITYDKGAFDVYVNGESIMNGKRRTYKESHIRHFYIDGSVKFPRANDFVCTVKHVLLYNRALNKTEIDEMKNVDKYVHQDIPMISAEQTDTVVAPTSSSKKQHADTSMSFESKPGATLEYPTSLSDTKQKDTSIGYDSNPKDTMKYSESSSTMHNEENTDLLKDETPPEDGKDKPEKQGSEVDTSDTNNSESEEKKNDKTELKNLKHHSHGGDTKTNDKHVDGAVWMISFSAWMCLACTAILLAGF